VPTVLTFYDFTFRAQHALGGRSAAAGHLHWHTYTVRLWFTGAPDQDQLSGKVETFYRDLHGADLGGHLEDSSDEGLALQFLNTWATMGCVRVRVTNDGRRGAEAIA
jgi:hypothetical protein